MADALETLIIGLRAWSRQHDANVLAAVELLIWHDYWLRKSSFTSACVKRSRGSVSISWTQAREFIDAGPRGSTSEIAVLDLAVALGEDRYRFRIMGDAHARAIAEACSRVVGIGPDRAVPTLNVEQKLALGDARYVLQRLNNLSGEPPSYYRLERGFRALLEIVDHLTGASHA